MAVYVDDMRELPILFSAPMVRAILEGRKTMTRRMVKPQPPLECSIHYMLGDESWLPAESRAPVRHSWEAWGGPLFKNRPKSHLCGTHAVTCPYGVPGDRLWVREAWRVPVSLDDLSGNQIAEKCLDAGYRKPWCPIQFEADEFRNDNWHGFGDATGSAAVGRYRHARFMPRWASRITLEVTGMRVERLQDITSDQILAEGVQIPTTPEGSALIDISTKHGPAFFLPALNGNSTDDLLRAHWAALWVAINGIDSWNTNPWVWVVEFKRIQQAYAEAAAA